MKKIISVLICSLALSGCATLKKELVVRTKPVEKPRLDVSLPQPVKMQPMQWVVITDKNYNDVIETVKDSNGLVFLVALDESSYKNLAINNANLLRYIREEKAVIAAYKQYYEKPKEETNTESDDGK
jgi:hypothetical protein